ncbi:MAG: hypothetical protein GTO17_06570 [Candidatus Aminicenantes bacterium]|nr:hypothetical protein [Candidatus Aminicenantes bacterium]
MRNKNILDSWKDISKYLGRDIRTCYRWEKELGLPIHRIDDKSTRSKVFAYKSEIDQWLRGRAAKKIIKKKLFLEHTWGIVGVVSGLILVSVILAILYLTLLEPSLMSESPSIAVLPFKNQGSSESEQYLSRGITNEIIKNLVRLNRLNVIPRYSAPKYDDSSISPEKLNRELGVSYILKGEIEKVGNKINLTVQLIRTKDNANIWSTEFEEPLENIFYVQNDICSKVIEVLNTKTEQNLATSVKAEATPEYPAIDDDFRENNSFNRLDEENNDPWTFYIQGKYYAERGTQGDNELAIQLFCRAIELDNNFALAYIGLANCYVNYVNYNWNFDISWLKKAEELVKKAHTIEPNLPEYYSTLIQIYLLKDSYFNMDTKKAAFALAEEGIKDHPHHARLNSIVGYCYYMKFGEEGNEADFEKAIEFKEKNFWLNPYVLGNVVYAELLTLDRKFNEAIEVCNILKKHDSSQLAKFRLGDVYYYSGDLDKSEALFLQFETSSTEFKIPSLFYLAMIAAQKEETEKARTLIQKINLLAPEKFEIFDNEFKLASAYMGLGEKEMGYEYLESFFNDPITNRDRYIYIKYIDLDKNFDDIRGEERFKKILRRR